MTKKQRKVLIRIIVCAALTVVLNIVPIHGGVRLGLFLLSYLIIGYDILRKASLGIIHGRVFDENFLMAIATVGAFVLAILERSGDYNEAVAVMLFYQIGELFQSCAVGKSRRDIGALMDLRPEYARVERGEALETVSPDTVEIGSVIVVNPGEKIPIDGYIIEGESSLNTVALTGESMPRDAYAGQSVVSGCVNLTGVLRIRTEKMFSESAVSKILELTEHASSVKSKSERFISKFARIYTPAVCLCALALGAMVPTVLSLMGREARWTEWIYRALTFLVISCPCALVISIPLGFFASIGAASRGGILIKGSNYIETLSRLRCVAFDKTGTLTNGTFKVREVLSTELSESEILEYAAHCECASSHPVANSIREAYSGDIDSSRVKNIRESAGNGVECEFDGAHLALGNERLMRSLGIEIPRHDSVGSAIYLAKGGAYIGTVLLDDEVKPGSARAISELKALGVTRTVMLTGDSDAIAREIGERVGIDEVRSELLPSDKVECLEELLSQTSDGTLAFVGDGINDAPSLARADIGVAMGGLGSDAAIEASDAVIMDDDPHKLVLGIRISKKCMRIVRQNIVFSLAVKFACLAAVASVGANMWLGIFADVGVMVLAVLNSIRAMRLK